MARTRRVGRRSYYEKQPRKFPYGVFPYVQPTYWVAGYCENET